MGEVDASPGWSGADSAELPCALHPEGEEAPGQVVTPHGTLHFLNLRGSFEAMAAQMGERLAQPIQRGAIPFYADYIDTMLRRSPRLNGARGLAGWAAGRLATSRLKKNLPDELFRGLAAMARGAGLELDTVLRAKLMPETFLWLLGQLQRLPGSALTTGLEGAPILSSTSTILRPPAANTLLHGRNLDFFGIGHWDAETTVAFYHPDDGMGYVSVASAGVLGGGITAMNAAGLTLSVHQHFHARLDLGGIPVGYAGDMAMRNAHNIEQAVAVLRDFPPVASWTYLLCEGDTGRAAIFEVGPGHEKLRFVDQSLSVAGYTNQYWGSDFRPAPPETPSIPERSRDARAGRLEAQLGAWADVKNRSATPPDVARVLADCTDPVSGNLRVFGPCIANVNTVASVIFEPAQRRVWVAAGASPTPRNWYIPFGLKAQGLHTGGPDLSAAPFIVARGWHLSAHGQAMELYRKACVRYWEGESDGRLLILIEHALALYPHEPNLHVLAGLLALRIGRARRAEGAFRRALEHFNDPARRAELGLYLAWALDLQGQRSASKFLYKRVFRDEAADALTRTRAGRGRWSRLRAEQARKLPLDFIYAGVP